METRILEIAERIKGLREMMDFTPEQMAQAVGISLSEYLAYEGGQEDFNFTFLYKCADKFGVDIVELLTGENPRLSFYSIVRAGEGLDIKRREGFKYEHLGYRFKNKIAETFLVSAPYIPEEQEEPIRLSTHEGQEFDYIISGSLKTRMEDHVEVLNAGDAIYYDSGRGHGMIATGGQECVFLAIVMRRVEEKDELEDKQNA